MKTGQEACPTSIRKTVLALALRVLERLAIDFLYAHHEPLAAIEHGQRRLKSRRDHAVGRTMRPQPLAHEEGRVEFRPEHRHSFEETLGIHFAHRLAKVALA